MLNKDNKESIKESNNNNDTDLIFDFIKDNFPKPITNHIRDKIKALFEIYSPGWLLEALKVAVEAGKPTLGYVQGILKDWQLRGFRAEKPKEYSGKGKKPIPKLPQRWPGQEEKLGILKSSATGKVIGFR